MNRRHLLKLLLAAPLAALAKPLLAKPAPPTEPVGWTFITKTYRFDETTGEWKLHVYTMPIKSEWRWTPMDSEQIYATNRQP